MNNKGIGFMLLSTILISLMHVCVKFLSAIPVTQIILVRSVTSLVLCLGLLKIQKVPLKGEDTKLLFLRGVLGTLSITTFFYTLHHIPLATAITISNLSPLFIAFFAAVFMKERFHAVQWLLLLLSFAGVVLIKGFDYRITTIEITIAIASAVFSALAHLSIRIIKKDTNPWLILFYFTITTIPCILPFAAKDWTTPTPSEWLLLLLTGLLSHVGQYFLTRAYQSATVSSIANIYYLGIALSILYGYFIFHEALSLMTCIGIVIIAAGLFVKLKVK